VIQIIEVETGIEIIISVTETIILLVVRGPQVITVVHLTEGRPLHMVWIRGHLPVEAGAVRMRGIVALKLQLLVLMEEDEILGVPKLHSALTEIAAETHGAQARKLLPVASAEIQAQKDHGVPVPRLQRVQRALVETMVGVGEMEGVEAFVLVAMATAIMVGDKPLELRPTLVQIPVLLGAHGVEHHWYVIYLRTID
jgi:hypothetical protein